MIKQLTKLSKLHKSDLKQIRNLADHAEQQDRFKIKLYWYVIENRLTNEFNDFFYYVDGNLVAYLGLFTFQSDEAEITAVVHPKYRSQGLFKKMLGEALLELHQRQINYCVWICPRGSVIDEAYIKALSGEYTFSQVEMLLSKPPVSKELPQVFLRPATKADLLILAKIGSISFQSSFSETLQRFTENMEEKNRYIWLLSTAENENIGKIHVRIDESNAAFIHDLCILPEHRGKNYAMSMIMSTIKMLRDRGQRQILLDVECDNQGALRLYQQCGFEALVTYDFWRVPTFRMKG